MSDLSETFAAIKEAARKKRASNRENGAALLVLKAVPFEERNLGRHLIVSAGSAGIVDYWPGTGLWIVRSNKKKGRGAAKLLELIQKEQSKEVVANGI